MMGNDSDGAHSAACLDEAGRPILDFYPSNTGTTAVSTRKCSGRRVISRFTASIIVAIPGFVLLGLGLFLFKTVPYPGTMLGQEPFALYFCGLTATTTGTAALAAAVFLAVSNFVGRRGKEARYARIGLGLALIAALAGLA